MSDSDLYTAYFTIFLIFIIFFIFISKSYKPDNHRLPPTPFRLPIIGHLHLLAPSPHRAFHELASRHGPVFRIFLGSTPCIVANSPEIAKQLYKTHANSFLGRPTSEIANLVSYGGKGFVFSQHNSYWKFIKNIIMSELLSAKNLDLFYPIRHEEIGQFLKHVSHKAKDSESVNLQQEFMCLTSSLISRMLIRKKFSDRSEELNEILNEVSEVLGIFNPKDHIWLCKRVDLLGLGRRSMVVNERFDVLLERVLRDREDERKCKNGGEEVKDKDLLGILQDALEDKKMEIKLTRENVKALIKDLFIAGSHSSATTMEWVLAELINHPHVMKKVVEEIDRVVGKNKLLQESDVQNLPYLQAVVKEVQRLHPTSALISKQSTEDCTLGGYNIPADTTVWVNVWGIGRDSAYWENPLQFRPERFEEKNVDVRGQHYELIPFGSGRRMCPGISLAFLVIHTTIGAMIQCFEWKVGENGNLVSVDMEERQGITVPRANPLVCIPISRLDPVQLSM